MISPVSYDSSSMIATLCTKTRNREIIAKYLPAVENLRDLVLRQMVWDRHINCHRLSAILDQLKKGNYGWEWHRKDLVPQSNLEVEEGILSCYKCNSKKIKCTLAQTRSGDEGQTVSALCTQCGNRWICPN